VGINLASQALHTLPYADDKKLGGYCGSGVGSDSEYDKMCSGIPPATLSAVTLQHLQLDTTGENARTLIFCSNLVAHPFVATAPVVIDKIELVIPDTTVPLTIVTL
jgi:hypothetical protein